MRIAIPSKNADGLESEVEEHFGRARYYTIIEIENRKIKQVEVVEYPYETHNPGDIPEFLHEHNVDTVISYGMGRRAQMFFRELGIETITGASGKIGELINRFLSNTLSVDEFWREHGDFGKHEGDVNA